MQWLCAWGGKRTTGYISLQHNNLRLCTRRGRGVGIVAIRPLVWGRCHTASGHRWTGPGGNRGLNLRDGSRVRAPLEPLLLAGGRSRRMRVVGVQCESGGCEHCKGLVATPIVVTNPPRGYVEAGPRFFRWSWPAPSSGGDAPRPPPLMPCVRCGYPLRMGPMSPHSQVRRHIPAASLSAHQVRSPRTTRRRRAFDWSSRGYLPGREWVCGSPAGAPRRTLSPRTAAGTPHSLRERASSSGRGVVPLPQPRSGMSKPRNVKRVKRRRKMFPFRRGIVSLPAW